MLTFIGILVVPFGVYWLLRLNVKRLFYLFAVTTPFSAATIVEFKGSTFGMPPSFFIAILLICTFVIRCISSKSKIRLNGDQRYYYLSFSILWLYNLLSLLFPVLFLLLGNSYSLFNPAFSDKIYTNDVPSYTITQFVYFTFFVVTSFAIMNETTSLLVAKKALKIMLYSALFTVLWGVVFYVLNVAGVVKYPQWIFNNHPGYSQGFDQKFSIIKRMSSVAQEPSVYGYFLSIMISMVMMLNVLDFYVLKPAIQKILCFIMIITAIMTTSTTAYLGIFVAIMTTLLLATFIGKLRSAMNYLCKQLLAISLFAVGVLSIIVNKIDIDIKGIMDALYQLTVMKASTGSGEERSESFYHGIGVLSDTYYLGSGFASNRNFDLGSTIMANTGIIGLILFTCSLGGIIALSLFKSKRSKRSNNGLTDVDKIVLGLVAALMTALALMFTSIPDFVNMYFWLILGLLMGMTKLISYEPQSQSIESNRVWLATGSRNLPSI